MEFKQVNVAGELFNVALVTKPISVGNYLSLDVVLAEPGDFVIRDRFFNLFVMTAAEAKHAFGSRLDIFK